MLGVSFLQPTHSYPETGKKKKWKKSLNKETISFEKNKKKKLEQEYTAKTFDQPHSFNPASLQFHRTM